MSETASGSVRARLLDAAVYVIRARGYSGTTVDDMCSAAGTTKGGFFHHFGSKEELGVAAAHHFARKADGLFRQAPYRSLTDPLERLLGYVDFRKAILQGELPEFTCLLGTMVQETYDTHPVIRAACEEHIWGNAAMVQADIEEAMAVAASKPTSQNRDAGHPGIAGDWTAESLALHTQAVLQGAFILAKAKGGGEEGRRVAVDSIDHLRRYLELLFNCAGEAR